MTPILAGACDSPGTALATSAAGTRATRAIDRLGIGSLLRDRGCGRGDSGTCRAPGAGVVGAGSRGAGEGGGAVIEGVGEPLPPVVDMVRAGEPGGPLVHPEWGTNVGVGFSHSIGDADGAFARADVTVNETFHIQRYVGMPLEGRGVVAAWDRRDGTLTTWNSTQVSHFVQQGLTTALGLPPHKIRVIAPDLGGGFGTKASGYAEDALVPIAAMAFGRPVKWIESRREHMSGAAHARHHVHPISLAAARDGAILGVRDRIWPDLGAYNAWGVVLPY